MKRLLSILLAGILLMSLFTACSKKEVEPKDTATGTTKTETETKTETDTKTEEPVKLIIWGGVPAESGPQNLVDAWNAKNPNTQVEYVRYVNDDTGNTQLDTALLSGEPIDLYFTYSVDLMKKRVEGGMMEDLTSYGVDAFIKDNVVGAGDGIVTIEGTVYGVPTAREPFGLMFNKSMLESQAVTIAEDWTVEDFKEVSKKLTHEVSGVKVYGAHTYYAGLPLDISLPVLGGDHYYNENGLESNFDAKEFKTLSMLKGLMDEGYALPYEEIFTRKLEAYAHPAFLNSEVAMMPFSAWMLRYVKDLENFPHDFITTFAPYPTTEAGVPNNYQAQLNNFLSINSESAHKEQAWAFLKYWATEGSEFMLPGGKIPVWNKADPDDVTAGILGEDAQKLFDVEAYKKVMLNPDIEYIVDTVTVAYPQVMQIYKEESEMYFLGATTEEEYFTNLKQRTDEVIKEELAQ